MPGRPVSLPEFGRNVLNEVLEEIHKACPGEVTAWDPVTDTVVVKPSVKRPVQTPDGVDYEELPEIPFVPVQRPRAGGYVVTCPILPGDTVLLVFSDFSLAEWRSNGETAEPADVRRHSAGWPVAIPGLFPDTKPLDPLDLAARSAGMILGRDGQPEQIRIQSGLIQIGHTPFGAPIEISATGIKLGGITALDAVALATPTMAGISGAYTMLSTLCTALGDVVSKFNAHTHVDPQGGAVAAVVAGQQMTAAPSAPGAPSAVAATLVKAV